MISFVMLTWNRRAYVEKCLASFYQNKSPDNKYEFIIIDNGSNDGTVELLKSFKTKDRRLRIKYNRKNKGINEYKRLLKRCRGDYIVIIDDDVIEFPENFDSIMVNCINEATDFGFLALDVVQNEHTDGAKLLAYEYLDVAKNGFTISVGPTGGWCSILRRADYKKIKLHFNHRFLNMAYSEDGRIAGLMWNRLHLNSGIIKNVKCLHASGPYYSKLYGHLERDITKYKEAELNEYVKLYESHK